VGALWSVASAPLIPWLSKFGDRPQRLEAAYRLLNRTSCIDACC
jgi:hypothetical protein